ncbi:MAG: hypothetical protein ACK5O2_13440 [Microthrixaceae bacterium]
MTEQRVLAGLAHPRSRWPTSIARWSTSGALAAEFLTCLSADELMAMLAAGRAIDAVMIDAVLATEAAGQVDRDLMSRIHRHGTAVIGIDQPAHTCDWDALGVSATMRREFDIDELSALVDRVCTPQVAGARRSLRADLSDDSPAAMTIGVCGVGGAGSSTVSMCIAQALAADDDEVVLVDGAARAHLAMYHDIGDVIPGLGDVVTRTRTTDLDPTDLANLTFATGRGYRLLAGVTSVREARNLPPVATAEALDAARRCFEVVVVDHDSDMASGAISTALVDRCSAWVVVTVGGLRGIHEGARLVAEAIEAGVPDQRIVLVCNRTRRTDPARATFGYNVSGLLGSPKTGIRCVVAPSVRIESAHRDGSALPEPLVRVCSGAVRRIIDTSGVRGVAPRAPKLLEAIG